MFKISENSPGVNEALFGLAIIGGTVVTVKTYKVIKRKVWKRKTA